MEDGDHAVKKLLRVFESGKHALADGKVGGAFGNNHLLR